MSSSALDSQGMTIGIGNGASPNVFSTITEVKNIAGPGGAAAEIDASDLASTAKEFRMGLQDEGQVTLTMNWIPTNTQHALLRTQRAAQALTTFLLTFTDSPQTTWKFDAFVQEISISNAVDALTEGTVTLRVSGAVVQA
jgi:hypothetical protein